MLDENEMREWEQRSSRGLLGVGGGGGGQKQYPRSLEWPRMTNQLLTEHGWSEVAKITGKVDKSTN